MDDKQLKEIEDRRETANRNLQCTEATFEEILGALVDSHEDIPALIQAIRAKDERIAELEVLLSDESGLEY